MKHFGAALQYLVSAIAIKYHCMWLLRYIAFSSWILIHLLIKTLVDSSGGYLGSIGCDVDKALTCEYNFLLCKLFNGPANDRETLCSCASIFYGSCLRMAGVSTLSRYSISILK